MYKQQKPQTHGSQETPRDTGASLWKDNTRKVRKKFHSAGKNEKSTFQLVELTGESLGGKPQTVSQPALSELQKRNENLAKTIGKILKVKQANQQQKECSS